MTIELGYEEVRKLAKAFSQRTNREIKHTDIINDIASVVGMRGDAMMHALKTTRSVPSPDYWMAGVFTQSKFIEDLLYHFEIANDRDAVLAVVSIGSYDPENPNADLQLSLFAKAATRNVLKPITVGYIGNGDFVIAWPYLDYSGDTEDKVNRLMREFDLNLNRILANAGETEVNARPQNYVASAVYLEDKSRFTTQKLEGKITELRVKAHNLVRARTEFPAFPRTNFL